MFNLKKFKAKSYSYSIGDKQVPEFLEGYLVGSKSSDGKKSFHILEDFFDSVHWTNQIIESTIEWNGEVMYVDEKYSIHEIE